MRVTIFLILWLVASTATCTELAKDGSGVNKSARVALIIGNSAYPQAPLANPANDASDLAYALEKKGFDVLVRENVGERGLKEAVAAFANHLKKGGVGLFFFAGHGTQLNDENQLVPVDASLNSSEDMLSKSVSAEYVLDLMSKAGNRINIVILDACRNNPFDSKSRAVKKGLAAMNVGSLAGTFISYATSPGSMASDGSGHNGLYTQHLLRSLEQPGSDIDKVFGRVRTGVATDSKGEQVPWTSSSITGSFFFDSNEESREASMPAGESKGIVDTPTAAPPYDPAEERLVWEKIKDSQNLNDYEKYLSRFGGSQNANYARFRLERLGGKIQDVVPVNIPPPKPVKVPPPEPVAIPPSVASPLASVILDCPHCPELIVLPPGEFMMGKNPGDSGSEPDEAPQHRVRISQSLAVGKFEVTRRQFSDFIKETGYAPQRNGCNTKRGGRFHNEAKANWQSPGFEQTENDPVVCVSWEDSNAYLDWLSKTTGKHYRLPSEAEWEYIAQGANLVNTKWEAPCKLFNMADASSRSVIPGVQQATCNDGYLASAPVGSFPANSFGVFDILGNVWEWVGDCWNKNYVGAPSDGGSWTQGDCGERVFRGGGWDSPQKILHYAYRDRGDKVDRYDDLGFRVLRTLP